MKKLILLFICSMVCLSFSSVAKAQSVYYCGKLSGYDTLEKPSFFGGLHKTHAEDNGCKYVIDGQKAIVSCSGLGTDECVTIGETDEKIDFVCPGSVASSVYTISKKENKVFYAKNGVLFGKGYQIIMTADCK